MNLQERIEDFNGNPFQLLLHYDISDSNYSRGFK